jgi:hypothetical protein
MTSAFDTSNEEDVAEMWKAANSNYLNCIFII